jgi:hypothetical protein
VNIYIHMLNVKIVDNLFSHAKYSTDIQESKYVIWDRTPVTGKEEIVFYTDNNIFNVNINVKKRYAWLLESTEVTSQYYNMIKHNYLLYDKVFTYNKELLKINNKFCFSPTGGCWIYPNEQKIHDKTKLVSTIMSNKNFTSGHRLRHQIRDFIENIDYYGRDINPISNKIIGLKDYMFSVVVENTKTDYYFTEKLIDCLRTGTIPIYYGCPSISNFFDIEGIITFNNIDELKDIISNISQELYYSKIDNIRNNFETSYNYIISEDYIFSNHFDDIFNQE